MHTHLAICLGGYISIPISTTLHRLGHCQQLFTYQIHLPKLAMSLWLGMLFYMHNHSLLQTVKTGFSPMMCKILRGLLTNRLCTVPAATIVYKSCLYRRPFKALVTSEYLLHKNLSIS